MKVLNSSESREWLCQKIQEAEERIIREYAQDEMKTPMHLSTGGHGHLGQIPVAVGVIAAMPDAPVLSSYRSHAAFLAKTQDFEHFWNEMYGHGEGRQGSMHLCLPEKDHLLSTAVVGTQIPVALGVAYARGPTIVFFGDGATETGVFWESMNLVSLWKLPVLLVLEDNGLAMDSTKDQRHAHNLNHIGDLFHINQINVNGRHVEDVYQATMQVKETLPTLMVVQCQRYKKHVGI